MPDIGGVQAAVMFGDDDQRLFPWINYIGANKPWRCQPSPLADLNNAAVAVHSARSHHTIMNAESTK